MSGPESALQKALSLRLSLQMSISSLPVIEEHMDMDFTRWLESIPTPMENPNADNVAFRVACTADRQGVVWSAFGSPRAIIPKLANYLTKVQATSKDIDLLNALGEKCQPEYVGSWVAVSGGEILTGWQFCQRQSIEDLKVGLTGAAFDKIASWAESAGLSVYDRFAQTVKDGTSRIELDLDKGADPSEDGRMTLLTSAVDAGLATLPGASRDALASLFASARCARLGIDFRGDDVIGASVKCWGPGDDTLTESLSLTESDTRALTKLGGVLGAEGIDAVEVALPECKVVTVSYVPGVIAGPLKMMGAPN